MSSLNIRKVVVTSGPTREFFDPIRYLSNPSTGKMGYFIAKAAFDMDYKVVFISGPVLPPYNFVKGAKNVSVVSTQDMQNAVLKEVGSDSVLIMAAAPADFKPERRSPQKLKKKETKTLRLYPNKDILEEVNKMSREKRLENLTLIGFAAETHNLKEYSLKKLESKNLDIIFLNDLSKENSGFQVDTNQLRVFRKDGTNEKWPLSSKKDLGRKIMAEIKRWLNR